MTQFHIVNNNIIKNDSDVHDVVTCQDNVMQQIRYNTARYVRYVLHIISIISTVDL